MNENKYISIKTNVYKEKAMLENLLKANEIDFSMDVVLRPNLQESYYEFKIYFSGDGGNMVFAFLQPVKPYCSKMALV